MSTGSREGSLEAPTRHALGKNEPGFYDEAALFDELGRVFDILRQNEIARDPLTRDEFARALGLIHQGRTPCTRDCQRHEQGNRHEARHDGRQIHSDVGELTMAKAE